MYSKQQASQIRRHFWTSFGQYMRPLPDADGEPVNWLNYKTGIKHLYFRMDVDQRRARIGIEMRHPDPVQQEDHFNKFEELKSVFIETVGDDWHWELYATDEDGKLVSRISAVLDNVNVFKTADWPLIISFLKPRMIALDRYWSLVKESF